MAKKKKIRPKRTWSHVIASQSQNYVEKFFIDKGHTATSLPHDYGTDLLVETFDKDGYAENGFIRIQLKARRSLKYSKNRTYISVELESRHCLLWIEETYPVFLVVYDAHSVTAYYLYIQEYFASKDVKQPRGDTKGITVRVPTGNKFTTVSVDYMQERKASILRQIKGIIKHDK